MSLAINTLSVTAVLLPDGWHEVKGDTFDLDAYEYVERVDNDQDGLVLLHGGAVKGVPSTGFSFTDAETDDRIAGPITAVQAVKYKR